MNTTRTLSPAELPEALRSLPYTILDSTNMALDLTHVEILARVFCPVQTGALRDTIEVQRPSNTAAILRAGSPAVTYAEAVHDGTSRQVSRPFLVQALLAEALNIAEEISVGVVARV